ncbi:hypothetical protein KKB_09208 [Kingella kingae PYKK081]|nr:hypothetical protein KKB_09208 [Kingella kingae PYKK081]
MHSLEEYFARIPDTRRGAGKRYNLAKTLTVIVVAILGGAKGNREIGAFLANNIDIHPVTKKSAHCSLIWIVTYWVVS